MRILHPPSPCPPINPCPITHPKRKGNQQTILCPRIKPHNVPPTPLRQPNHPNKEQPGLAPKHPCVQSPSQKDSKPPQCRRGTCPLSPPHSNIPLSLRDPPNNPMGHPPPRHPSTMPTPKPPRTQVPMTMEQTTHLLCSYSISKNLMHAPWTVPWRCYQSKVPDAAGMQLLF